jgi:hypothetical protein
MYGIGGKHIYYHNFARKLFYQKEDEELNVCYKKFHRRSDRE